MAQAQLAAERAQRPEAVHDALATAGEALQERIDTLRVRAHLGRMDVASGVALAVDDLDRRVGEVRDASRRARYTTTSNLEEARQAAVVSAQSSVEATQAGYEVGTRTIVDVLISQQTLLQAQSAYSTARHAYVLNRLLLKQAAGVIEVQDLEAINALLE